MATTTAPGNPMRAVAWALVAGLLVIGWFFIIWQNKFHMTAPTVMLCLGYLAVIATVTNLWRVGAAAVAPEDATAEAWARPVGPRDFLEKEKKTLLKAIKEAEFDLAMGKLSKADADQLITMYRTRAIAVIKELERLDGIAAVADKRSQIEREVAARLALEGGSKKAKDKAAQKAAKAAKKAAAKSETFVPPPKPGATDDDDEETEVEKTNVERTDVEKTAVDKGGPPIRESRPATASFSTSNEGDQTPIPPPAPERASMMSFSTSNDGDHTPLPPPTPDADGETKIGPPPVVVRSTTETDADTKVGVPPAPDKKEASS